MRSRDARLAFQPSCSSALLGQAEALRFVRLRAGFDLPARARPIAARNTRQSTRPAVDFRATRPKFQPPAKCSGSSARLSASTRQPLSGSSTCCQGRVAAGLRMQAWRRLRKRAQYREQPLGRPIAAANDISRADSCDADTGRKK